MSFIKTFHKLSLTERLDQSEKIIKKYPDRIPIIVYSDDLTIEFKKNKYLVPKDLTMGNFHVYMRKNMNGLAPTEAFYFFVNNSLPQQSTLLSDIYKENVGKDGFLIVQISKENTFGSF